MMLLILTAKFYFLLSNGDHFDLIPLTGMLLFWLKLFQESTTFWKNQQKISFSDITFQIDV